MSEKKIKEVKNPSKNNLTITKTSDSLENQEDLKIQLDQHHSTTIQGIAVYR